MSSYLKIKNIEITGSINTEIKNKIDEFYGKNVLLFRPGKIKEDLMKEQSSIEDVEIIRGIPDTLKVQISVRTPAISWKSQNKVYFIDSDGYIFELQSQDEYLQGDKKLPQIEDTKNIPIELGTKAATPDFIEFILEVNQKLPSDFNIKVNNIKVAETTFQIEIETDQGFRIIMNTMGNLENQIKALKKVLDEKRQDIKEYVDLRIEGRVYYK